MSIMFNLQKCYIELNIIALKTSKNQLNIIAGKEIINNARI